MARPDLESAHGIPPARCLRPAAVRAVVRRLGHLRPPGRARRRARDGRGRLGPRRQLLRQRRGLCQRRGGTGDGRRAGRPAAAARRLVRVQQGLLRLGAGPAPDPEGPVAQARPRRLPRRAAAAAGGLPGPLFLPPAGPRHADRRDRMGDGRAGPPGQGPVLGHLGVERRADPRGARGRARAPPCGAGDGAAAVQPAGPPQGGAGVRAAVRRLRDGHHHVLAAGLRAADRQVQRRHPRRLAAGAGGARLAAARAARRPRRGAAPVRRAAAAAGGLPGPLFLPPAGPRHADRRNRMGDGRAGPPGQGPVLGHLGVERRARWRSRGACATRGCRA
jgi:predicted small lipoprotein YifL